MPLVIKSGFSSNFPTIFRGFVGILGSIFLLSDSFFISILGLILIYIYATLDFLDEELARIKKMVTLQGEFLDIVFVKLIEGILFILLIFSADTEERKL